MATLAVWTFDTSYGAEDGGRTLQGLPDGERDLIQDVARVSWVPGSRKPATRLVPELVWGDGLGEAFWGVLLGLIFYSPLIGAAVASANGGLSGSLADFGIDDTFVNRVRDTVTPGTSALFVLGSDVVIDQIGDALRADQPVNLLLTRLSPVQEGSLRQVFVG